MNVLTLFKQAGTLVALCVLTCSPIGNIYAQDNQASEILHQMSAEIAGLDEFIITGDGYVDAGLGAGQIIEQSMDVTMRMSRPNAMRITNREAESTKEIYFGNGVITVYGSFDNQPQSTTGATSDYGVNTTLTYEF